MQPRLLTDLQRLLRACDALAADLTPTAHQRRLGIYISVLERYWHEIDEKSFCTNEAMAEYWRKIERLADLLDESKLLSGAGAHSRAHSNSKLSRGEANAEIADRLNAANRVQQALREKLMHHVVGPPAAGPGSSRVPDPSPQIAPLASGGEPPAPAAAGSSSPAGARKLSTAAGSGAGGREGAIAAESVEKTLEEQRQLQDTIVDDTAHLLAEYKSKALQARRVVAEDVQTLDTTDEVLEANQAQLDANNEKLRAQLKRMQGSTCIVWLMMLVVCAMFVGTFLLMKVRPKRRVPGPIPGPVPAGPLPPALEEPPGLLSHVPPRPPVPWTDESCEETA